MKTKYLLNTLDKQKLELKKPCIIFLKWDLWAWKTTFSKYILNILLKIEDDITSPTFSYYNKYWDNYHFDLYRLNNYDEFFAIWAEDILDNNTWVILIEWPELIANYYKPDIEIFLSRTGVKWEREIDIKYY